MRMTKLTVALVMTVFFAQPAFAEPAKTVVLELFTSQGCSSCPPADALLRKLSAEDVALLPLSFHIDYWDNLGWKDPFSSRANTDRQKSYSRNLDENGVYTPQLVINGTQSMVGSREDKVRQAVANAKSQATKASVKIVAVENSNELNVAIAASPINSDVWEVRYNRSASTNVAAGESGGKILNSINNVKSIKRLPLLVADPMTYRVMKPENAEEGLAILVQTDNYGPIIGAASF